MAIFGQRPPKIQINPHLSSVEFTVPVPATDDKLDFSGAFSYPILKQSDRFTVSSTVTLPAGLTAGTQYYAVAVEHDDLYTKASLTKNGGVVQLTDVGTGTHTLNAAHDLELDHTRIIYNGPDSDNIEHRSPLSGARDFLERLHHWRFEIEINLYKYGFNPTHNDHIRSIFEELFHIFQKSRICAVWPHRDGDAINDVNGPGNPAHFRLTEFRPFYLDQVNYYDRLYLKFESLSWVNLSDESQYIEF